MMDDFAHFFREKKKVLYITSPKLKAIFAEDIGPISFCRFTEILHKHRNFISKNFQRTSESSVLKHFRSLVVSYFSSSASEKNQKVLYFLAHKKIYVHC